MVSHVGTSVCTVYVTVCEILEISRYVSRNVCIIFSTCVCTVYVTVREILEIWRYVCRNVCIIIFLRDKHIAVR